MRGEIDDDIELMRKQGSVRVNVIIEAAARRVEGECWK
jgi:hypothetical protein